MKQIIVIVVVMAITMLGVAVTGPAAYAEGEPGAPTNMSVMKLGTGNLSFSWDKGSGAVNTIVISKVGSWPEDRSDGAEIYNGSAETFEAGPYDIGYDTLYVRAWSENASVYSLEYAQISVGGDFMDAIILIVFVALAAGLLVIGVINKVKWISAASAIPWALTAYFAYQQYDASGSLIWEMFALFGLVMFVIAGVVSIGTGGGAGEDSTGQEMPSYLKTRARIKSRMGDD